MTTRCEPWRGIAFVVMIACLLNLGPTGESWTAWEETHHSTLDRMTAPIRVLYRRAGVEELYFATASAVLGRPYDAKTFGGRGASPFPPVDVPADGHFHVPYVDVPLEYPPPNLPLVIAPALFAHSLEPYTRVFGAMMGALLLGAALLASKIGGRDAQDRDGRLIGFGLLLLAHGALAVQCLDALVALLLVLMVRAAVRRRDLELGFWSGIVFATKFLPAAVGVAALLAGGLELAFSPETKRRGGRFVAGGAIGAAVGLGPLIVLSPSALGTLLRYHGDRGLHVESSLGVLYGATKAILGEAEKTRIDYGSFNFHGALADGLAKGSTLLLLLLIAIALFASATPSTDPARAPDDQDEARTRRIVLAALLTTLALWLGGKVFSPQYLTWALPLVIALPGRSWRRAAIAFGIVLVLSQAYLRGYYDDIYNQRPLGVATLVVRLVMLGGFFVLLVRELGARGAHRLRA